ncbi:hypothetical protein PXH69_32395 [Rhodococcus qingshengii]|uniref:YncE family protein n=1 Tax=Rhodococcus qingshengii TaxID=334542 RepID=A0AAW6LTY7_RHOSG|nr:hypothetical protein [Rhodococcus qingshengii]MDE8649676.1 hypothetical protein [Rhodococcus qingshengii]
MKRATARNTRRPLVTALGNFRRIRWNAAVLVSLVAIGAMAIPASAEPLGPGESSSDPGIAYIPSDYPFGADSSVRALNIDTGEVERKFPVGPGPLVVKESFDHSKLYVSSLGVGLRNDGPGIQAESALSIIDKETGDVRKVQTLGPPFAVIQLSADGRNLYIPTAASVVQVLDTTTDTIIRTIPTLLPPSVVHIEVSPDEKDLYTYTGTGVITKYNMETGQPVGAQLTLGPGGWGTQSRDGRYIYAVNLAGSVAEIDTESFTISKTFKLSTFEVPVSGTLTPDGKQLWLANYAAQNIEVFDTETGSLVHTMKTSGSPSYVSFSQANDDIFYISIADYGLGDHSTAPNLPAKGYLEIYDKSTMQQIKRMYIDRVGPGAGIFP